ncbi:hypothetical protein [Runella zeae]|uniref:hypothetical protein n=1 Tax=Runella zeae TaxID=94255 RepID=UPI0003FF99F6|nr:hypothetical protein [Runella zeae]
MQRLLSLLLFSFFCCFLEATAQQPQGRFLTDSIEVGKPFQYALSFRHSSQVDVFFPDTSTDFQPFQVIKLEYFPTETTSSGSLDSAIYTLVTFDLNKTQTLEVPVWALTGRDCTAVYSQMDSIRLRELISPEALDTLHLQTDTQIVPLRRQPNFPFMLLVSLLILMIGTGIYLLFGESITKQWELFLMFRRNQEFVKNFARLTRDVSGVKGIDNVEKAVILWKKYLQRLERKPYATYTTKEITDNLSNNQLAEALKSIDSLIYGGLASFNTADSLNILREVALQSYRHRRIEIAQATPASSRTYQKSSQNDR